jgi:hypothetical protein
VRALGLRRVGHTVEITDDPAVRGQVHAVRHLVDVEAVAAPATAGKAAAGKAAAGKAAAGKRKEAEA